MTEVLTSFEATEVAELQNGSEIVANLDITQRLQSMLARVDEVATTNTEVVTNGEAELEEFNERHAVISQGFSVLMDAYKKQVAICEHVTTRILLSNERLGQIPFELQSAQEQIDLIAQEVEAKHEKIARLRQDDGPEQTRLRQVHDDLEQLSQLHAGEKQFDQLMVGVGEPTQGVLPSRLEDGRFATEATAQEQELFREIEELDSERTELEQKVILLTNENSTTQLDLYIALEAYDRINLTLNGLRTKLHDYNISGWFIRPDQRLAQVRSILGGSLGPTILPEKDLVVSEEKSHVG